MSLQTHSLAEAPPRRPQALFRRGSAGHDDARKGHNRREASQSGTTRPQLIPIPALPRRSSADQAWRGAAASSRRPEDPSAGPHAVSTAARDAGTRRGSPGAAALTWQYRFGHLLQRPKRFRRLPQRWQLTRWPSMLAPVGADGPRCRCAQGEAQTQGTRRAARKGDGES